MRCWPLSFVILVVGCNGSGLTQSEMGPGDDMAMANDMQESGDMSGGADLLPVVVDMVPPMWMLQTSGTTSTDHYQAVWGSGPNDVYVVGHTIASVSASMMLHSTGGGSAWSPQTLPTGSGDSLNGIWGSSSSDVYAVGGDNGTGVILHSTGNGTWTSQNAGGGAVLQAVWGSGPTDVYAVGLNSTILHSTGNGTWTPVSITVSTGGLFAIWGSAANDIYLAGSGLYHFTGSGDPVEVHGQSSSSPPPSATNVYGVWGSSTTSIYDVGAQGWIGQVSSGTWGSSGSPLSDVNSSFFAIAGCNANEVFAVGTGRSMSNVGADAIVHHSQSGWQMEWFGDSNNFDTSNGISLFGVWCSSTTGEVYAAGSGGTIRYRP